ncbi:MAG: hypothetical protein ABIU63_13140 [Chitinophagaceae bacterium]
MRVFILFILLGTVNVALAQTVTGSWYGLAEASAKGANNNNYLTELVIKQKGVDVEGIFGYYFRSGYQSYYIRGKYNPKTRLLTIKNVPVTYYKSRDIDGIDCPMDFAATLFTSRLQSTLSGSFSSHEKYKYTCPQLNFVYTLDINEKNQDSLIHASTANVKKYWKPRNEELVINTKDITETAMADRAVTAEKVISAKGQPDTLAVTHIDSSAFKLAEAEKKKELAQLVVAFDQRKTILSTVVDIESDSVRISFYDNGDIDGDSITIFINKVPVLTHQPLSEKALNMYLAMDNDHLTTEISMYAENLGKYPPNTALMVITDGAKRKEVFLSSSLTQNSSVILKKRKR